MSSQRWRPSWTPPPPRGTGTAAVRAPWNQPSRGLGRPTTPAVGCESGGGPPRSTSGALTREPGRLRQVTLTLLFDLDETLVVEEPAAVAAFEATAQIATRRYTLDPAQLARDARTRARELWRAAPTHPLLPARRHQLMGGTLVPLRRRRPVPVCTALVGSDLPRTKLEAGARRSRPARRQARGATR